MIKIPNRDYKFEYLFYKQFGLCGCGCGNKVTGWILFDFHHKLKDDKGNRKNYPLFIHSILNLDLVLRLCHQGNVVGKLNHYTPYQAETIEKYLIMPENRDIAIYINTGQIEGDIEIIKEKIAKCEYYLKNGGDL